MRTKDCFKSLILLSGLILATGCNGHFVPQSVITAPDLFELDKGQIETLHNVARAERGHKALERDLALEKAAQLHADWMAKNNKLDHRGENRSSVSQRVGDGWIMVGENIACGQSSEGEVVKDWMNSKGHRQNILNSGYTHLGIGISISERGVVYWCVDFGA